MDSVKPSCFISYSHDDMDKEVLSFLIKTFKDLSEDSYDFLVYKDLPYGNDIDQFMDFIMEVDAVVILFSPSYYKKVMERKAGGVYNEYKKIIYRHQQIEKEKKMEKRVGR